MLDFQVACHELGSLGLIKVQAVIHLEWHFVVAPRASPALTTTQSGQ